MAAVGPLEEVVVGDLGGGDLEAAAQARLERAQESPLFLQSAAGGEVKVENGEGDDHRFSGGTRRGGQRPGADAPGLILRPYVREAATSSVTKASMTSPTLTSW